MPSDTFAAGFGDLLKRLDHRAMMYSLMNSGVTSIHAEAAAAIRNLTPTASEATAIGAGEVTRAMEQAYHDARNDWSTRSGLPMDLSFAWPRIVAAFPKVASDTAPGVAEDEIVRRIWTDVCSIFQAHQRSHIEPDCRQAIRRGLSEYRDMLAALAASPTASDTDTAIPGGWKQALEAIAINSNCDWDEVRKRPAKHIDLIHTLAVDALYPASPKPDTDTPVDPGVEGVREAEEVERDIRIAIWNAGMAGGMGQNLTQAFIRRAMAEPMMARALAAIATKPIAGMDAGES